MKITQFSTSSSSSSFGTSNGDRRPSSPAKTIPETPNPSTPTTTIPPSIPSTATPLPRVDPATIRHLENILRGIPTEKDPAAAYAILKAQFGITRGDDSDEEEGGEAQAQPIAALVEEAKSVPPPPAEGTPAQNIPSLVSGGGSTSAHGPQSIEVVEIDDDDMEDLLPLPSDILLQQRETDWIFHQAVENEQEGVEEQPLRRRTRRMIMDHLLGEAEALRATQLRREDVTMEQRPPVVRRLVDEEEPVNHGVGEAVD